MTLNSTTRTSKKEKHARGKRALAAKVDLLTEELSQSQDEMEFYYSSVIESLAVLEELRVGLEYREQESGVPDPLLERISHKHQSLMKKLIDYYPEGSDSQKRAWDLLECDGLVRVTGTTPDGYVSLSSDLILRNVERAIALTKVENLRA